MGSSRDLCPDCMESGWACTCRPDQQIMTKTDPLATLEPCPFCEEQLKWFEFDNCYHHEGDDCIASRIELYDADDVAVWNTRSKEPQSTSPALPSLQIDEICDEAVRLASIEPGNGNTHWQAAYHAAMLTRLAMQAKAQATSPGMREVFIARIKAHALPLCDEPEAAEKLADDLLAALSLQTKDNEEDVERVARAICRVDECDPDDLEPGNTPFGDGQEFFDGTIGSEPAYFLWRNYVCAARAAISALSGGW